MSYAFDLEKHRALQREFQVRREHDAGFDLAPRIERELQRAVEAAPLLRRIADAGKLVVRHIHTVPRLYRAAALGDVDLYLGRAGATARHVHGRFSHHARDKGHSAGTVVLRCATTDVVRWEGVAVRVLRALQLRERLCVANIAASGAGAIPRVPESVIYLTWRTRERRKPLRMAQRRDIAAIARQVSAEMDEVPHATLLRALDPISRPATEVVDLDWARGHVADFGP